MPVVKTYSKSELAAMYGVHRNTFVSRWLVPYLERLRALGYKDTQKLLTPAQVGFLFSDEALGEPPEG